MARVSDGLWCWYLWLMMLGDAEWWLPMALSYLPMLQAISYSTAWTLLAPCVIFHTFTSMKPRIATDAVGYRLHNCLLHVFADLVNCFAAKGIAISFLIKIPTFSAISLATCHPKLPVAFQCPAAEIARRFQFQKAISEHISDLVDDIWVIGGTDLCTAHGNLVLAVELPNRWAWNEHARHWWAWSFWMRQIIGTGLVDILIQPILHIRNPCPVGVTHPTRNKNRNKKDNNNSNHHYRLVNGHFSARLAVPIYHKPWYPLGLVIIPDENE